ncbi:hypothetical protein [Methanohalophilus portucalensis]|uniref:Uncharacterized protein n=2 Tax=Methanohalophilus portucalensis TaxID=39664 RepID=A0A1X7N532_9EURY|nr:hypothetical protein [Methanohalophilus portucalensis]ATU08597.1 hypothetical protein BKM01_07315 [Methanohalophilus portucalensis]RNI13229.1 hypothetical protein EFE41_01190 [Methanohalophilus portucalensis FDF-1]SMH32487.1 hypothetical protein SAMN06264941_0587 [Methanohalophilus portucalensis FDF-1]
MKKYRYRKKCRTKNIKSLIDLNWGKWGPYGYAGLKAKNGISVGYSFGTRGQFGYASYNKRRKQLRLKYNMDSGLISPRIKHELLRNKKRTRK